MKYINGWGCDVTEQNVHGIWTLMQYVVCLSVSSSIEKK